MVAADSGSQPSVSTGRTCDAECEPSGALPKDSEYLCYFVHRYLDFRRPEVEAQLPLALASSSASLAAGHEPCSSGRPAASSQAQWREPFGGHQESPFWYLRLPSEAVAQRLCERTMLIKHLIEVWGEAESFEQLLAAIAACPEHRKQAWDRPDTSFKIVVDGWGGRIDLPEQLRLIEALPFEHYKARVDLVDPEHIFRLIIVDNDAEISGLVPTVRRRWFFGRQVGSSNRRVLDRYALTRRVYLGPTTMDTELAFLICNQAQVRKGSLVYDPFVGTGSILVAAAHLGAQTLGADIDIKVVREGKQDADGNRVDVWSNFAAYQLPAPVGLLRADAHRPPFREDLEEFLDAVVCDPPYGVRAGGRKSVANARKHITNRASHVVATDPYPMGECVCDLLQLSARLLRIGGRLVFFFPTAPETYSEDELPRHPALELVANSEQPLTSRYSRRLLTMVKARPFCAATDAAWRAESDGREMLVDKLSELVFEPRRDSEGNLIDRVSSRRKNRGKLV